MVIPAIVTPIKNKQVDQESLDRFLQWLKAAGIEQVIALGSTGEGAGCDAEIAKCVFDIVEHAGIECILGIANPNPVQVNKIIQHVKAKKVMLSPPFTTKPKQQDIVCFFQQIAGAQILLYNNPARFGCNIEQAAYKAIIETCDVFAVKECANPSSEIWDFLQQFKHMQLLAGDDVNWQKLPVQGCVSVLANCFPALALNLGMQTMITEPLLGKTAANVLLWEKLCELLTIGPTPLQIKYLLNKLGLCSEEIWLAYQPLTKEQVEALDHLLESAKSMCEC